MSWFLQACIDPVRKVWASDSHKHIVQVLQVCVQKYFLLLERQDHVVFDQLFASALREADISETSEVFVCASATGVPHKITRE